MSTIKVNVIEPYSGSTVSVVGLAATASNAIWSGISGIPAGLVSGSYSSSMSTRITAQEDFSSSLDATFATEAELNAATASLSGSASTSRQAIAGDLSTVSSSLASRVTSQENFSSSLDATFATDAELTSLSSSLTATDQIISGNVELLSQSADTARQAIADDLSTVSSSLSSRVTAQENFSSSLDNTFATEAELNAATASLSGSASTARNQLATDYQTADTTLSSSLATDISTNADSISTLNGKTLVSSSIAGDSQGQIKVNGVNVNVSSLQTTSNPTFANLTGSNILVNSNLTVQGTASFARLESVTGSAKIIGDAYIILNNNTPAERYAGLVVQDSGSAGVTASLEFDGQTNDWFYEYSDDGGVTTDHGVVIFGPEYSTKGSPTYLTNGTIPKSTGSHHIVDSNITDNGSLITLGSNTSITGTVVATGTTLVSGSAQVTSLLPSGVVSGSAQTIQNLPAGTVSGSAQTIANLPAGTVSGSAQINLASATGTAANATSASYATTASFALSAAGGLTAQTASTSLTMSANVAYVVTGTAAPITMSLPASPTVGELIKFSNMDDRATLLGRNGNNLMGLAEDMTLNVEQVSFDLVYVGPTAGWTIYGSRALS